MSVIKQEREFIDLSEKIGYMMNIGTNKRICIKKSEKIVGININCGLKPNLCKNKFLFREEYKFTNLLFDKNNQEESRQSRNRKNKMQFL